MINLSASEQITYSTVRIECEYENQTNGTGTGFFFQFLKDEQSGSHIPVVITNKHVINNSLRWRLIFTKANTNNEPLDTQHFEVYFDNFETHWRKHPDKNVDLCVMPIAPFLNEAESKGEKLFYIPLDKTILPTKNQLEDFSALEDILMVWYPNWIWDSTNNKPILRKEITASHPNLDYCWKKELMIDAACFPWSSWSPVFIFNENWYKDKKGTTHMWASRIILLGILYAWPQQTTKWDIKVINVPTVEKSISVSQIPINLGLIIKSEIILELEDLFR